MRAAARGPVSQNIGRFEGVHADASTYDGTQNPSFREKFGEVDYRVANEHQVEHRKVWPPCRQAVAELFTAGNSHAADG